MKRSPKAQALIEYVVVAILVMSGILVSGPYVIRAINSFYKVSDDQVRDAMTEEPTQWTGTIPNLPPCQGYCDEKDCGNDGCGGSCGVCPGGQICSNYRCVNCTASCAGKACGDDGCGHTTACGSCTPPTRCVDFRCVACEPNCTDKECGDDGCSGDCGPCNTFMGETCVNFQCNCVPNCTGKNCGSDGCGGSCGTCGGGQVCNNGNCCTPNCSGGRCGSDGCGNLCPDCPYPQVCNVNTCCTPNCPVNYCGPNSCNGTCPQCPTGQVCFNNSCCSPLCPPLSCGPNGCGGFCGNCVVGLQCILGTCCAPICPAPTYCGPDSCGTMCPNNCPSLGMVCYNNNCCALNCPVGYCGPDGCGGYCPACTAPAMCYANYCCTPTCFNLPGCQAGPPANSYNNGGDCCNGQGCYTCNPSFVWNGSQCVCTPSPSAPPDGIDNDCDGTVDEPTGGVNCGSWISNRACSGSQIAKLCENCSMSSCRSQCEGIASPGDCCMSRHGCSSCHNRCFLMTGDPIVSDGEYLATDCFALYD